MSEDVKSYYAQLKEDITTLFRTSVARDECSVIMEKYGYDCSKHACYECRNFLFNKLDNYVIELQNEAEAAKPGEKIQDLIDILDSYVSIDPSEEGFKFFKNESFYKNVIGEKPLNTSSYYDEYYAFRTLLVQCREPNDTVLLPLDKNGVPCRIGDTVYLDKAIEVEGINNHRIYYTNESGHIQQIDSNLVSHEKPIPSSEPLPCPFCGAAARVVHSPGIGLEFVSVRCPGEKCDIAPSTSLFLSREKAIEKWNNRAALK